MPSVSAVLFSCPLWLSAPVGSSGFCVPLVLIFWALCQYHWHTRGARSGWMDFFQTCYRLAKTELPALYDQHGRVWFRDGTCWRSTPLTIQTSPSVVLYLKEHCILSWHVWLFYSCWVYYHRNLHQQSHSHLGGPAASCLRMSDVVSVEERLNLYADLLPAVSHADKTVASIIRALHAPHMLNTCAHPTGGRYEPRGRRRAALWHKCAFCSLMLHKCWVLI